MMVAHQKDDGRGGRVRPGIRTACVLLDQPRRDLRAVHAHQRELLVVVEWLHLVRPLRVLALARHVEQRVLVPEQQEQDRERHRGQPHDAELVPEDPSQPAEQQPSDDRHAHRVEDRSLGA